MPSREGATTSKASREAMAMAVPDAFYGHSPAISVAKPASTGWGVGTPRSKGASGVMP